MSAFTRLTPIPELAVHPGDIIVIRWPGREEAVYIASTEPLSTGTGAWNIDLIPDPGNEEGHTE